MPEADHDPGDRNGNQEGFHDPSAAPISNPAADPDDLSDDESILSDVDEAQFEDFDPNLIAIEERPAIAVDEDNVKLIGRHKRKRDAAADTEGGKKKKKEGRREKVKKSRKKKDSDDDFSGGQEVEGKRIRKKKAFTEDGEKARKERSRPRERTPENEEELDPEERKYLHRRRLFRGVVNLTLPRPAPCPRQSHGRRSQKSHQTPAPRWRSRPQQHGRRRNRHPPHPHGRSRRS